MQDAFLSAFRSRTRFEGSSRISTWLHRIVINSCLMRLRARSRHPEVPIEEWLPAFKPDGHHETTFTDWSNAAHTALEKKEMRAQVRRAIDRLPESYRTVLLMRDIEGMAMDEITAALDISANAVKIRLHRARQALRTLLDPTLIRGVRAMTCREVADFILDYLSGELSPEVRDRFDRHLAACPNCRAYIATYVAAIELATRAFTIPEAGEQAEVPEDLVSAIVDSLCD